MARFGVLEIALADAARVDLLRIRVSQHLEFILRRLDELQDKTPGVTQQVESLRLLFEAERYDFHSASTIFELVQSRARLVAECNAVGRLLVEVVTQCTKAAFAVEAAQTRLSALN